MLAIAMSALPKVDVVLRTSFLETVPPFHFYSPVLLGSYYMRTVISLDLVSELSEPKIGET